MEQLNWNNVKGSALFFRAQNFFQLAQLFCKPYIKATAASDLGIPLRLEADISAKVDRSSVESTYSQIINDLTQSLPYLPDIPTIIYRPSKVAACALLARTYLQMGDYNNARTFAQRSLQYKSDLNDFNNFNLDANYTFSFYGENNPEVLFLTYMGGIR